MTPPRHRFAGQREFARWARSGCPPVVEILRSVSSALAGRLARDLDGDLDDLARRLFDVPKRNMTALGERLVELVAEFAVDEAAPEALLLDAVLTRRTGHPELLAVVLAEAGRRAGFNATVASSPGRWYAAIGTDGERALLIAPADPGCRRPPSMVRRHCGHELALAALLGLRERYRGAGAGERALQTEAMLLRLGFDVAVEPHANADPLRALWSIETS